MRIILINGQNLVVTNLMNKYPVIYSENLNPILGIIISTGIF